MAQYATTTDFDTHGLPLAKLPPSVTTDKLNAALIAASAKADSYLRSRFTLPISSYGLDLTEAVCAIAAWSVLSGQVGFNPEAGHNVAIMTRKEDAIRWLEQISHGHAVPEGIVDSSPSAGPGGPAAGAQAYSNPMRGWGRRRE